MATVVFHGATLKALHQQLGEYGVSKAYLAVTIEGDPPVGHLQVSDGQGRGDDPLNDSHVCPGSPGCP